MEFKKALKLSKTISKTLKFLNFEGTSFPGGIVQKYCPDFLNQTNEYVGHPRFAITGTNGKTTTSTVLSKILEENNLKIINNKLGANMPNGIVTALSSGLFQDGEIKKADGVVLECDEAYFSNVSSRFVFDYILITNLFRDQLDRYGEMDIARKKIVKGIELNPNITVILNADDPSLSEITEELKYKNKKHFFFFGITSINYINYEKNSKSPSETLYCPICGEPFLYRKKYYAQLGDWYCRCSNSRPKLDVQAKVIIYKEKCVLDVEYKNKTCTFETSLTGLYNAYNVLGAISCALLTGVNPETIKKALNSYSPIFGRHQKIPLKKGGVLTIHLIKNPVGASEVLRGLKDLKNSRMLISINDNYADGRDVSWLWDSDFESLADFSNVIYTTGTRSYDMALRLKHAGFNLKLLEISENTGKIVPKIEDAIEELNEKEDLVVLVTYTGLLEINKHIKKLTKKYGSG